MRTPADSLDSMILQENSLTVTSVNDEVQYTFPDPVEARAVQIVLSRRGSDVTVRCSHEGRSRACLKNI